jgi:hypothetical protein
MREEHRLRVFKNRVLLDKRGWKGQETGNCIMKSFMIKYPL